MTYRINARELLRQLESDSNDDGLAVVGGPEELQNCYFLLLSHLGTLLFHLLNISGNILDATESLKNWNMKNQTFRLDMGRINCSETFCLEGTQPYGNVIIPFPCQTAQFRDEQAMKLIY